MSRYKNREINYLPRHDIRKSRRRNYPNIPTTGLREMPNAPTQEDLTTNIMV